jgi:peptidoglycan/LPS O-acetylase OafA/YrhL
MLPHWATYPEVVLYDLGVALTGVWLIGTAAVGFSGLPGRILQSAPLVYLGMISYGLYMYHNFVPPVMKRVLAALGIAEHRNRVLIPLYVLSTIAVASISWFLLERPLNNLKRHFPYRAQR